MKLITATFKPYKLDDVRAALLDLGIEGMTVTDVKGFGQQKGHAELYRGADYVVQFLPKTKMAVVVSESRLNPAVEAIERAAKTGQIGDGKIFVSSVAHAIRIRTGEIGDNAI